MAGRKTSKQTKGNKYAQKLKFADEVLAKNVKHAAQNSPSQGAAKEWV